MPVSGGKYSMNPQVAKMQGSATPAAPAADPNMPQDPMSDPDVQAAIQLLQQKGITPDMLMQAMEPDADQMGGPSDEDADNSPAEEY
jgi:hypothetical protein